MTTPVQQPVQRTAVAVPMPAPQAGIGSAFSAAMQTAVYGLQAIGKVAQTADELASIALAKSQNMRESVIITDSMQLAILRHAQRQQMQALEANGVELRNVDAQVNDMLRDL